MGRSRIIAANWKMNPVPNGAFNANSAYMPGKAVAVAVFPALLDLKDCVQSGIKTGGQWASPLPNGAQTGDVSMSMLKEAGCMYVMCGHSERRQHHKESDAYVAEQVKAALAVGLIPFLCIGETADEREMGQTNEVLKRQLAPVTLTPKVVIAYEPVWAIGTGKTATPQDAQKTHAYIRSLLPFQDTAILYGGSMNEKNARDLLAQPDIDGGLIGGASLEPAKFAAIVATAGK